MKRRILKRVVSFLCICSLILSMSFMNSFAGDERESTQITFNNIGIDDGTYTGPGLATLSTYSGSLLNTMLTHKITISNHAENAINYAGTSDGGGWYGIKFRARPDGQIQISGANKEFAEVYYIDPTVAETPLFGQEITLGIELIEDGQDVKLGVFINGTLYNNAYFKLTGAASKLGSTVGLYVKETAASIKIGDEESAKELTPITFQEIGIDDGIYTGPGLAKKGTYSSSLLNTTLTQKITISNHAENAINYAGTSDGGGWYGIKFRARPDGQIQISGANKEFAEVYYIDPTVAETSLFGQEITLGIELIEDGQDVKLGVFINGTLYNNAYFKLTGAASKLGSTVGLYVKETAATIKVGAPEIPDVELTPITFENLGIAEAKYAYTGGGLTVSGKYIGSLLNTSLTQKITFSEVAENWINYAGTLDGWYGIRFKSRADGTIQISAANNEFPEVYIIDPTVAQSTLIGEQIELRIDLIEDKENVKLGVFINGELYNNAYFTLTGATDKLGSFVGLYSQAASCYIKIGEEDELPDDDTMIPELTEVSLTGMGIANGKYTRVSGLVAQGKSEGSLLNTSMTQKFVFSKHTGNWMLYAGASDGNGWYGIRFRTLESGGIQIGAANGEFTEVYYIDPKVAGVALLGEEITLTIDLIESGSDVKLGVSVNGELYNDAYFTLAGAATKLGNSVGFYVQQEEGYIIIGNQEAIPVPDSTFQKLTFASYEIESGSYGKRDEGGLSTSGHCGLDSMDRVIFSDTICFSEEIGVQLRIGGMDDAWYGMIWQATAEGMLYITDAENKITPIMLEPKKAGVELVGKEVELMLSFEHVDSDRDGKKDDVKLGIWFDGKAYNDRWIYLRDYAGVLGGYLGIYSPVKGSTLSVWTYFAPIDFAEFGFTSKWAYTLGLLR